MSPSGHGRVAEHFLRTFGAPALLDGSGQGVPGLRKKDLALLIYLCLEGPRRHSRSALAGLLWGDGTADKARHSLTQALRRVRSVLPPEAIDAHDAAVEWRGPLACDARLLEEAAAGRAGDPESATRLYTAHFLQDFAPGRGANEFELWADGKRKAYRVLVLQLLDRLGREAEGREAWAAALELGRRAAEIEPIFEEAQRRVMRAWRGLGERTLALEHYERFATWLSEELGAEPDPATQRLAAELRAPALAEPRGPLEPSSGLQALPDPKPMDPQTPAAPQPRSDLQPPAAEPEPSSDPGLGARGPAPAEWQPWLPPPLVVDRGRGAAEAEPADPGVERRPASAPTRGRLRPIPVRAVAGVGLAGVVGLGLLVGGVRVLGGEEDQTVGRVELAAPTTVPMAPGERRALSARVFDPEGKSIHGVPIRWESTDTAVAVVDSMGVVTARAPGRALIVASAGGQRADTLSLLVERRERVPLPVEDLEAPASTSPPPSPSRTPPLPRSR